MGGQNNLTDRFPFLYYDGTAAPWAAGQTLQGAMGLVGVPMIPIHGQRRLVGVFRSSLAPAAGSPTLNFNENGVVGTYDLSLQIQRDLSQPLFVYPFDIPVFQPYVAPLFQNGAGAGAVVRVDIWVFPEGTAPPFGTGNGAKPPVLIPVPGFETLAPTSASPVDTPGQTMLTVPVGARYAMITVEDFDIRWRDDGIAPPTALVGEIIPVNQNPPFLYSGDLNAIRFIGTNAVASRVSVSYYQ